MAQSLEREVGDFVVLRADGVVAYHLAVVVDDAQLRVNEVVRGSDLLESTPRQILIQRALGLPTPEYAHLPVAVGAGRHKLSKQNLARPIAAEPPGAVLVDALEFLGQRPPRDSCPGPRRRGDRLGSRVLGPHPGPAPALRSGARPSFLAGSRRECDSRPQARHADDARRPRSCFQ